MARKGVPDEAANEVLGRFRELRLIDDQQFASDWVDGQQRRLRSSRVLRQELRAKGVDADLIDKAIDEGDPGADEAVARALLAKRAPALARLDPTVRYRRLAGLLARRGFSSALISRLLAELGAGHLADEVDDH